MDERERKRYATEADLLEGTVSAWVARDQQLAQEGRAIMARLATGAARRIDAKDLNQIHAGAVERQIMASLLPSMRIRLAGLRDILAAAQRVADTEREAAELTARYAASKPADDTERREREKEIACQRHRSSCAIVDLRRAIAALREVGVPDGILDAA